jgi:hypothetical protein
MNCLCFDILAKLFEVVEVEQAVEVKHIANGPCSDYKAP